jgi:hypothetical protein
LRPDIIELAMHLRLTRISPDKVNVRIKVNYYEKEVLGPDIIEYVILCD